jgi:hypothetical protein
MRHRLWVIGFALGLPAFAWLSHGPTPCALTAEPPSASAADAYALAAKIDGHFAARWATEKAEPAPLADDAEFMRRLYLDLTGRIPSVTEARAFLDDESPDKRRRLIEQLLASPRYVEHFTNVWRALLLPNTNNTADNPGLRTSLETWLRSRFRENAGFDKLVREIVATAAITGVPQGDASEPTPVAFYQDNDYKPENLASSTSRLFLGIRLECAQCHDHPQAKWKREQFWAFAAFFAGIERAGPSEQGGAVREIFDRRELSIPGTEDVVQAAFLDETEPQWKFKVGARVTLADWLVAADNPFFARAAVNRLWEYFFGIGLVQAVDDQKGKQAPGHGQLLDEVASAFAAHHFDLKFLIRAITASRAYQLTTAAPLPKADSRLPTADPHLFARMAVKGLSPEQIFDSLALAVGYEEPPPKPQEGPEAARPPVAGPRGAFLAKFASPAEQRTEAQTSILQALFLMNGKFLADATALGQSKTLTAAIAESPDTAERIELLFLATLSRKPRLEELARLAKYVDAGGPHGDPKKALGDVFWVLLNSGEFILNH